ncbi:hypothetical protein [Streptomyces fuscichromogenes]|uniref:Uncharacterized protein n=1 Tax=Streptomyces fuscichromogenes TaxID=1324013 RepID=A0A917XP66_9ACTN|nr:hypothetical protein [Streptomyces fuscichromogenes]GGN45836.1 hypothetical protein GCM10011578_098160 [Streptomyces fuscichromogenes]
METVVDGPLLSMRSTLVFLLALLAGTAAGGLTALAGEGGPRSVLAGLAAVGLAVPFFNRLIGAEGSPVRPQGGAGAGEGESHG